MALTDIQAVRLKTGIKVTVARESTEGTGTASYFKLQYAPVQPDPPPVVRVASVTLTPGVDYTVDFDNGIIALGLPPAVNVDIDFTYYWSVYSDDEVSYFLGANANNVTVASAELLLALAADAARIAKRQTLIGGGGIGQATIDTSVAAKELRATAQALLDTEALLGESVPAEGLTEVPWTEMELHEEVDQSLIRNNGVVAPPA
jgi:hypothetical protein